MAQLKEFIADDSKMLGMPGEDEPMVVVESKKGTAVYADLRRLMTVDATDRDGGWRRPDDIG